MRLFSSVRDWLWPVATGGSTVVPTDGLSEAGKQKMYRGLRKACALLPACHMLVDVRDTRLSLVVTWSPGKGPTIRKPHRFALNGVDKTVVVYGDDGKALPVSLPEESLRTRSATGEKTEKPKEAISRTADTMQRLCRYLCAHYLFRYNLLTEQTEYAKREEENTVDDTRHSLYLPMDERAVNGICLSAMQNGIACWDRDVRRYLHSDRIEGYHPFTLYLDTLPAWDGEDRITPLAHRVSSDEVWTRSFHRWMLAMVAQWKGMSGSQANSVAPLLVSDEQGWGKSTFARTLLPCELRRYFTESFDLNAASSAELKLATFGLINLDEYDKLPSSRQLLLKNLMQMASLNLRRAYRQQAEPLRRIASFIGTSNRRDLLTDPTGSRRFICVELEHPIDHAPLDHAQLYAQLRHELASGVRYWFSKEEEAEIQRNNRRFYVQSPMEEVLHSCFTFCKEKEEGARLLSSADIYRELQRFNSAALRGTTSTQLSRLLPVIGRKVHTRYGNGYWVKKV